MPASDARSEASGAPMAPDAKLTVESLDALLRPYAKKLSEIQKNAKVGPIDLDKFVKRIGPTPGNKRVEGFLQELKSADPRSRRLVRMVKDLAAFEKRGGTFVLRSAEANSHAATGIVTDKYEKLRKTIAG